MWNSQLAVCRRSPQTRVPNAQLSSSSGHLLGSTNGTNGTERVLAVGSGLREQVPDAALSQRISGRGTDRILAGAAARPNQHVSCRGRGPEPAGAGVP